MGIVLMALAMCVIPMRDGIAKHLSSSLPVFTIAWGVYCASALMVFPIALRAHGRGALVPNGLASQTARSLLLVGAMTLFFFSVRTVPLANAIASYFVAPFVVAALAPVILREAFSWTVMGAVVFGFIGVLAVLRPDGNFDLNVLWSIAAGVLFAFYMLATRIAAQQVPPMAALSYQCLLGAMVLTPFAFGAGLKDVTTFLGFFLLAGVLQGTSHGLSIAAFRWAPASVLAPLVYIEIVAAVVVGIVVFGDWPTLQTWVGVAIILVAGALVALNRR